MNEPNLPGKYNSGDSNYGRVTKGAAYALRGQVYMWQKNWEAAVDDLILWLTVASGYILRPVLPVISSC